MNKIGLLTNLAVASHLETFNKLDWISYMLSNFYVNNSNIIKFF